jgi:hypothetical protein
MKTKHENRRKISGINKYHNGGSELVEHDALFPRRIVNSYDKT